MTDLQPFELAADLPRGLTVLEASAGTGKTWAIAALTVRYLADGVVDAPHLLAITFTRLASSDLRSRLYQRLIEANRGLRSWLDGAPEPGPDELLDVLTRGTREDVMGRRDRLDRAIGDFDSATVATIHEFCRRAADWLGPLLPGRPPNPDEDAAAALAEQVLADATLMQQLRDSGPLPVEACAALGRAALANPDLPVRPQDDAAAELVRAVRAEYRRRKRAVGVDDYSDLAARLSEALGDPDSGDLVAHSLAQRYHVVLVDEFQDTDPVQWAVLRRAFAARPLVLVGDPKQSIYGFRGADVYAYLDAVAQADARYTLPVNYRSDQPVVAGINAVFADADFGGPGGSIPMRTTSAVHGTPRLRPAGVELRQVPEVGARRRAAIDADLVSWVAGTLVDGAERQHPDGRWYPVRADDIAVLVSSNRHGEALSAALQAAGVPAVFSGASSVFASDGAAEWLVLLDALADPLPYTLRRAMAGRLVGLSLADLADQGGDLTVDWSARLREWARTGIGVPAMLNRLEATTELAARLISSSGGERLLTDVRHIAELLGSHGTDATGLAAWLRAQRRRALDSGGGDRTRRLETDRPAVTVMTVHAAKGLEFPVVLVPASADAPRHTWGREYPLVVRREGRRTLDTTTGGPGSVERLRAWADEDAAEDRRRLYVAMTRGSSLVIAWLGDPQSALSQLVSGRDCADVRLVQATSRPLPATLPSPPPPKLRAAAFRASIDADWVRTSYSGLTADLHDAAGTAPELPGADEAEVATDAAPESAPAPVTSPMDQLPAGAAFGTIVHAVLEACDPASPTLRDDLAAAGQRLRDRSPLVDLDVHRLADALRAVLHTPLGAWADDVSLADLGSARRLAELGFEMPLGGDAASTVADLAALFDDRTLVPADDPLTGYGAQLGGSAAAPRALRGFLTGSIDAIHELPDGRLALFDYKTNRLGPPGCTDTLDAYTRPAMTTAMIAANYPLQALLYAVALRRYLAWRRPDLSFDAQWAGTAYLFVRGMGGPATPLSHGLPTGVFAWRPSAELIERADAVLRGDPAGGADA